MRIIIMAKAPVAGQVKTRLQPEYSAQAAASLHRQMTEVVLSKALSVADDVWLATDDSEHGEIQAIVRKNGIRVYNQGPGCLGERLTRLMHFSFAFDSAPLMFIGADSPHVQADRYLEAFTALAGHDVVIGPVEDGGYDLIVMKSAHAALFEGIAWGSEHVLNQTLAACSSGSLKVRLLAQSFDLDTARDIERAPPESW